MKYAVHVMGMNASKYGGMERFNVALSSKLEENGIRSVFIYESYPDNKSFVDDLLKTKAVLRVAESRKKPLHFCHDFIKIIMDYHPIIVHAHFTKARFYAIPLAKLMGVKRLFFTIHSRMDIKKRIKPLTRIWYGFANRIAKVIVISDHIAATYSTNWPKAQVKRIYLGVNSPIEERESSRCFLNIPDKQLMLLTVANFNYIKGLDVLIRAVALLMKQGRWDLNTILYIVGQPDHDIMELNKLVDFLGISQVIKLQGISNDVAKYMASADIYIQPSRSEGLGLALVEAASYSLPLIGSRVGGIPEIIKDGENGLLVPPENEVQLAETIIKMIQDKELRSRFGVNSFSLFKESFSIEKGVCQTYDYYCV